MRYLAFLALLLATSGCSSTDAGDDSGPDDIPAKEGWSLVWNDEFDGPSIDRSVWNYWVTGNPYNNELQYYTNRTENARIEDGKLVIEAHKETFTGADGTREYTSARLNTRGNADFLYGRFEIRARLPSTQGLWPAIWMMPTDSEYGGWPQSGEIDIMELLGHQPNTVHGTIHYGGEGNAGRVMSGNSFRLPSGGFHEDFHVFALEWEEGILRWYVDDDLFFTRTQWFSQGHPFPAPFDRAFHLILNVAVGGDWPGSPDSRTVFPQRMEVDYVRVFERVDS